MTTVVDAVFEASAWQTGDDAAAAGAALERLAALLAGAGGCAAREALDAGIFAALKSTTDAHPADAHVQMATLKCVYHMLRHGHLAEAAAEGMEHFALTAAHVCLEVRAVLWAALATLRVLMTGPFYAHDDPIFRRACQAATRALNRHNAPPVRAAAFGVIAAAMAPRRINPALAVTAKAPDLASLQLDFRGSDAQPGIVRHCFADLLSPEHWRSREFCFCVLRDSRSVVSADGMRLLCKNVAAQVRNTGRSTNGFAAEQALLEAMAEAAPPLKNQNFSHTVAPMVIQTRAFLEACPSAVRRTPAHVNALAACARLDGLVNAHAEE